MPLTYHDYELPLLEALDGAGGEMRPASAIETVKKLMEGLLTEHPEELGVYPASGAVIYNNRTRWAREYLKRKGQLDASQRGVWKITSAGKERLRLWRATGQDPDMGLEKVMETPEEEADTEPEQAFEVVAHRHGDMLGLRGIVYEPINEQSTIILFAALAEDLGFLIEAIRPQFPDAQLARRTQDGTYKTVRAEFEFRSSSFERHGHDARKCDLIICWEHDWKEAPIEVLALRDVVHKMKG